MTPDVSVKNEENEDCETTLGPLDDPSAGAHVDAAVGFELPSDQYTSMGNAKLL